MFFERAFCDMVCEYVCLLGFSFLRCHVLAAMGCLLSFFLFIITFALSSLSSLLCVFDLILTFLFLFLLVFFFSTFDVSSTLWAGHMPFLFNFEILRRGT